jgi:hypothetical protein
MLMRRLQAAIDDLQVAAVDGELSSNDVYDGHSGHKRHVRNGSLADITNSVQTG